MSTPFRLITVAAACVAALSLSACDRDDSRSLGQAVDKTIADARLKGDTATVATQDAAKNVATGAADAMITTKVNAAFLADDGLKVMKVDVDTKNGRVVLMGSAPSTAARERATMLAKAVEGVTAVDNQLSVAPKP